MALDKDIDIHVPKRIRSLYFGLKTIFIPPPGPKMLHFPPFVTRFLKLLTYPFCLQSSLFCSNITFLLPIFSFSSPLLTISFPLLPFYFIISPVSLPLFIFFPQMALSDISFPCGGGGGVIFQNIAP